MLLVQYIIIQMLRYLAVPASAATQSVIPTFLHSPPRARARAHLTNLYPAPAPERRRSNISSHQASPLLIEISLSRALRRDGGLALSRLVSISLRAPRRFTASASPVPSSAAAAAAALIYDQHGSTDSCITLRRREPGSS